MLSMRLRDHAEVAVKLPESRCRKDVVVVVARVQRRPSRHTPANRSVPGKQYPESSCCTQLSPWPSPSRSWPSSPPPSSTSGSIESPTSRSDEGVESSPLRPGQPHPADGRTCRHFQLGSRPEPRPVPGVDGGGQAQWASGRLPGFTHRIDGLPTCATYSDPATPSLWRPDAQHRISDVPAPRPG